MLVWTVAFVNHQSVGCHSGLWPSDHTAASLHFGLFLSFFKLCRNRIKKGHYFQAVIYIVIWKHCAFPSYTFAWKTNACQWYRNSLTEYHPYRIFTCTGVVLHLKFYRVSNHLRPSEKVSFSFRIRISASFFLHHKSLVWTKKMFSKLVIYLVAVIVAIIIS